MIIRQEQAADCEAIGRVTEAAFRTLAISRNTEHFIIRELRAAGALALSLVAEEQGRIVGHIAFSPAEPSDGSQGWYALGPLAVLPELHRRGIGGELVRRGLSLLRERGAAGCALVGDPAYYRRFGFANQPELVYAGVPPEYFLALSFGAEVPRGSIAFHRAFLATS